MDNPSTENDCYTHECDHSKTCMSILQKHQGAVFKISIEEGESHHAAHPQRHLIHEYNDAGLASIAYLDEQKKKVKEEQSEDVLSSVEQCQSEVNGNANPKKRKRGSGMQQTLNNGVTYQNRSFCA